MNNIETALLLPRELWCSALGMPLVHRVAPELKMHRNLPSARRRFHLDVMA
ncbi:MAG: hypothetical protein ACKO4M_05580 [Betaproteobacteria bacterium]